MLGEAWLQGLGFRVLCQETEVVGTRSRCLLPAQCCTAWCGQCMPEHCEVGWAPHDPTV